MVFEYIEGYKKEIKKSIEDLKHIKTFYKQIPNLLTFIRLVFALPAGIMYYVNPKIFIGTISFLWFTDLIDGPIARKFNIQSKLGADMDAFADKIMFLGSSLPLLGNIPILIFNFIMEGIISGINVFGRMKGLNTKTVFSGKLKTVSLSLTLIFGYLVQYFGMSVSVLNLLIPLTTVLQLVSIKDYISEFKRMDSIIKENNIDNNNENNLVCKKESDKNLTRDITKISIEELQREKEFYLGFKEPDTIVENRRVRKIENEKKNDSFN